jgi:rhamnose utilization protein RhaD (predicted bifunctional aldolase and dehydrogenase)
MRSAWSDDDARAAVARYPGCPEDLALRVYTSRLIGAEPALVLHGGGNTSVKTDLPDDLGCPTRVALIKGSGWDLASIEPPGFPAVRLRPLLALRALESLDDEAMVGRCARGCSTQRGAQPLGRGAAARVPAAQVHRPLARRRGARRRRSS